MRFFQTDSWVWAQSVCIIIPHNCHLLTLKHKLYSSTAGFSSSFSNMLWHCFFFSALSDYSTRSLSQAPPSSCLSPRTGKAQRSEVRPHWTLPTFRPLVRAASHSPGRVREEGVGETNTGVFFSGFTPWREDSSCSPPLEKRHLSDVILITTECMCVFMTAQPWVFRLLLLCLRLLPDIIFYVCIYSPSVPFRFEHVCRRFT